MENNNLFIFPVKENKTVFLLNLNATYIYYGR